MKTLYQLATWAGLAAALVGAGSLVRGDWGAAAGCLVALIVASALAALWEQAP
jgi:hypothetical protein